MPEIWPTCWHQSETGTTEAANDICVSAMSFLLGCFLPRRASTRWSSPPSKGKLAARCADATKTSLAHYNRTAYLSLDAKFGDFHAYQRTSHVF